MGYMKKNHIFAAENGAMMNVEKIQKVVLQILGLQTITDIQLILIYKMQHFR